MSDKEFKLRGVILQVLMALNGQGLHAVLQDCTAVSADLTVTYAGRFFSVTVKDLE